MASDSISMVNVKNKYLHEVMPYVLAMCNLQFGGQDVAIPVLVGDGGIGKTANIAAMCLSNGFNLLDIHYGLIPLEEVSGIPDFAETININGTDIKNTKWTLPDILGKAWELAKNGKPTVVFLDDFHASSPGNMSLGYEIFTEMKLRGYPFPPQTAFVLAMNCSGVKSLANNIPAPIVNRLAMFNVAVDFEQWKVGFAIPRKINPKILGFLSNAKNRKYFQQEEQVNLPWASARSWTKFSTILTMMETYLKPLNHADILYYCASHVGEEAAGEFSAYYKIFSEIPVDDIFNRTIKIEVPEQLTNQYAFILATVSEFFNRFLKKDITKQQEEELYKIMAEILIETAKVASEITVTGMKDLLLTSSALKLRNVYQKIRTQLQIINPTIFEKIKSDIEKLG